MQPLMLKVFNFRTSPHDLFALTSRPQTLVAVAELASTSGIVWTPELPTTVDSAASEVIVPKPGVPPAPPGTKIPQSCRLGQGQQPQEESVVWANMLSLIYSFGCWVSATPMADLHPIRAKSRKVFI